MVWTEHNPDVMTGSVSETREVTYVLELAWVTCPISDNLPGGVTRLAW